MNLRIVVGSALLVMAVCSQAWALKRLINMTPALVGDALSFEMKAGENGKTRFTISRDPAKADRPADGNLQLVRGASLSIYGEQGLIARCPVAPREGKGGRLVYQFEIHSDHAESSVFTLSEIEDYKPPQSPGYIGGGTIYRFALIDFIDPQHAAKELQKTLKEAIERAEKELREIKPDAIYGPPAGGEAARLIHEKYEKHLIADSGPKSLLLVQNHYFHGRADDLNRFLRDAAALPKRFEVKISFTGPDGLNLGVPLTEGAAQAGAGYDWCVQQLPQGKFTIIVPLAGRIAFSDIAVPAAVPVEAGLGAPAAAQQFARIHNEKIK